MFRDFLHKLEDRFWMFLKDSVLANSSFVILNRFDIEHKKVGLRK